MSHENSNPDPGDTQPLPPFDPDANDGGMPDSDDRQSRIGRIRGKLGKLAAAFREGAGEPVADPADTHYMPVFDPTTGRMEDEPEPEEPTEKKDRRGALAERLAVHERKIHTHVPDGVTPYARSTYEAAATGHVSAVAGQYDDMGLRNGSLAQRVVGKNETRLNSHGTVERGQLKRLAGIVEAGDEADEETRHWAATTDPRNAAELYRLITSKMTNDGIPAKTVELLVTNGGIRKYLPEVVGPYFGVTAEDWKAQQAGGPVVVPPEVISSVDTLFRLTREDADPKTQSLRDARQASIQKGKKLPAYRSAYDKLVPDTELDDSPIRRARTWLDEQKHYADQLAADLANGPAALEQLRIERQAQAAAARAQQREQDEAEGITPEQRNEIRKEERRAAARREADEKYASFFGGKMAGRMRWGDEPDRIADDRGRSRGRGDHDTGSQGPNANIPDQLKPFFEHDALDDLDERIGQAIRAEAKAQCDQRGIDRLPHDEFTQLTEDVRERAIELYSQHAGGLPDELKTHLNDKLLDIAAEKARVKRSQRGSRSGGRRQGGRGPRPNRT